MPKQTHQPKTRKRARRHGFRVRMATQGGQVIKSRRQKGRARLSA